jgi:hypothetical protein
VAGRRRWPRRSPAPPVAATAVCPRCGTAGPARLTAGAVCAACRAQDAWSQLGGERLVIDRAAIDEAVRRREGEAAGQPAWRRLLAWLWPALALAAAALAVWAIVRLLSPLPIGPLAALLAAIAAAGRAALGAGAIALVAGLAALVRARRSRHFRRLPLLACHLAAIVSGAIALALGVLQGLAPAAAFGAYATMPPPAALDLPAHVQRIIDA